METKIVKIRKLDDIDKVSQEITKKIKTTLDLKLCKDVNTLNIDRNIIYKGVFKAHDEKVVRWHEANDTLECIRKYLNNFLRIMCMDSLQILTYCVIKK